MENLVEESYFSNRDIFSTQPNGTRRMCHIYILSEPTWGMATRRVFKGNMGREYGDVQHHRIPGQKGQGEGHEGTTICRDEHDFRSE